MTNPVSLLAAKGTSGSLPPAETTNPSGAATGSQGINASFAQVMGGPAPKARDPDRPTAVPEDAGRFPPAQAEAAAADGKGLPPSVPRRAASRPPAGVSAPDASGPNSPARRAASEPRQPDGQTPSSELVDMLKAFLADTAPDKAAYGTSVAPAASSGQKPSAPSTADAREALSRILADLQGGTSLPGAAEGAAAPDAPHPVGTPLGQLLKELASDGPQDGHALVQQILALAQGKEVRGDGAAAGGSALALNAPAVTGDSSSLPQWILQQSGATQAAAPTAGAPAAPAGMVPSDPGTAAAAGDTNTALEQLLSGAAAVRELDARLRSPSGGDAKGVKPSPGAASGGGSSPLFSTVFAHAAAPAQSPAGTAPPTPMPHPFAQKAWDEALGQNVVWMAKHNVQVASLRLNPPDLGPLELKVALNHDQANVSFVVHHAAVRDAIESALPRLREMLGDGGVNLANVDVSDHSAGGGDAAGSEQGAGGRAGGRTGVPDGVAAVSGDTGVALARQALGLVDYFA